MKLAPNFFVIGAPKAGTTALCEYLREHPSVFMSTPKELHFFNEDFQGRRTQTWEQYQSHFLGADEHHVVLGEGSASYLRSDLAVSRILEFNAAAKLIILLRNPIDLVVALHAQRVWEGQEDEKVFETAWLKQTDRAQGRSLPRFCTDRKRLLYRDYGMLGDQVEYVYSLAEKEQVLLLFYDDLISDPRGLYQKTLKFLSVPPYYKVAFEVLNQRKAVRSVLLSQTLACLLHWKKKLGFRRTLKIADKIRSANRAYHLHRSVEKETRQILVKEFSAQIDKIEAMTGRDLEGWRR